MNRRQKQTETTAGKTKGLIDVKKKTTTRRRSNIEEIVLRSYLSIMLRTS